MPFLAKFLSEHGWRDDAIGLAIALCGLGVCLSGGFNSLQGLIATALSVGGVLGPLVAGMLVQRFGFQAAFYAFAGVAAVAAAPFLGLMPETRPAWATATGSPLSLPHPRRNGTADRVCHRDEFPASVARGPLVRRSS